MFLLDISMELLQLLVNFPRVEHATLDISFLCVLPDLLNMFIAFGILMLLVECLSQSVVSFPQPSIPHRLVLVLEHTLTLVDDHVPVLDL